MIEVAISFGVQYGPEPGRIAHPKWPPADGDGYLVIEAETYEEARALAFELLDGRFAFDYTVEQVLAKPHYWPLGEIGRIKLGTTEIITTTPEDKETK